MNVTRSRQLAGVLATVALGFLAAVGGCSSATDMPDSKPSIVNEGRVAMTDGTQLYYRQVGDGPRTVVIPADLYLYPAFEQIAPGRRLIFYDMRNRGASDSVSTDRENSIRQDVADLEVLRAHLGIERFDLIGWSYLGLMVVMYAMEHPERVNRIVQIGPVPLKFGTEYPPDVSAADYMAALDSAGVVELRFMRGAGLPESEPAEYCRREWEITRFALVGDPAYVDRLPEAPCDYPNEWPINLQRHLDRHFVSVQQLDIPASEVARVTVPVLTIHGDTDRNAPYGGGREWAMMLPNARLITVPGGAHCPWADHPELVFSSIDAFLKGDWPEQAQVVETLSRTGES